MNVTARGGIFMLRLPHTIQIAPHALYSGGSLPQERDAIKATGEIYSQNLHPEISNPALPIALLDSRHNLQPEIKLGYTDANGSSRLARVGLLSDRLRPRQHLYSQLSRLQRHGEDIRRWDTH